VWLPGIVVATAVDEGAGEIRGARLGGRYGRDARFSSSEHGLAYNSASYALVHYSLPQVGMYGDADEVKWEAGGAEALEDRERVESGRRGACQPLKGGVSRRAPRDIAGLRPRSSVGRWWGSECPR
jgi:hypothetical protein